MESESEPQRQFNDSMVRCQLTSPIAGLPNFEKNRLKKMA